jgi:uncharacterized protein (UPF0335 family)
MHIIDSATGDYNVPAIKTMRGLVKIRRMDEEDIDEREALLDTYKRALGMLPQRARRAAG